MGGTYGPFAEPRLSSPMTGRLGWLHPPPLYKRPGVCWGKAHSRDLLLQVDQSGLFLPSRDYYLNRTANEKVRSILRTPNPTPLLSWADACLLFPLPRVIVGKVSLSCHLVNQLPFLPSLSLHSSLISSFPPSQPSFSPFSLSLPPFLLPFHSFSPSFLPSPYSSRTTFYRPLPCARCNGGILRCPPRATATQSLQCRWLHGPRQLRTGSKGGL